MATDLQTGTRLPATLEVCPPEIARWKITKLRVFRAIDGEGFEATVTLDGSPIGQFVQEGNGGGSWFRPSVPGAYADMQALCQAWARVNPSLGWTVIDAATKEETNEVREEHIVDSMVGNHRLAKSLNSAVKRGKTPVLTREQAAAADDGGEYGIEFGLSEWGTLSAPLSDPRAAEMIRSRDMLAWNGEAWAEVSA